MQLSNAILFGFTAGSKSRKQKMERIVTENPVGVGPHIRREYQLLIKVGK